MHSYIFLLLLRILHYCTFFYECYFFYRISILAQQKGLQDDTTQNGVQNFNFNNGKFTKQIDAINPLF